MLLIPLLSALVSSPAPDVAALIEKSERAFTSPERLSIEAHIRTQGSFQSDIKTAWWWAPIEKARIDIDGVMLRAPASARFISDGRVMQWPGHLSPIAPDLDRGSRLMFFRLGASFNAIRIASGQRPDGLEGPILHFARWSDVRAGKPERIDGRTCIPLHHTLLVAYSPTGTGTLWIDAKTHLPVRRRMTVAFSGGKMTVEETYRRIRRPKRPFAGNLFRLF